MAEEATDAKATNDKNNRRSSDSPAAAIKQNKKGKQKASFTVESRGSRKSSGAKSAKEDKPGGFAKAINAVIAAKKIAKQMIKTARELDIIDTPFAMPNFPESEKLRPETEVLINEMSNFEEIDLATDKVPLTQRELDDMALLLEHSGSSSDKVDVVEDNISFLPFSGFLDDFTVPSIVDIEVEEAAEIRQSVKQEVVVTGEDVGAFVDPLTGINEVIEEAEKSETEDEIIDVEEEESVFELPEIEELPKAKTYQEVADETFKKIFFADAADDEEDETDYVALAKQKEEQEFMRALDNFLKKLIDGIVKKVNYVEPKQLLRASLDKEKLIKVLVSKCSRLQLEQKKSLIYNRCASNYFRKKRDYRAIADDNLDVLVQEMDKLKYSSDILTELLEKRRIWNEAITKKRADLIELESASKSLLIDNISKLEEIINNTFCAGKSEKLRKDVTLLISRMARDRDILSETRFMYLLHLHNMLSLSQKLKQIEFLGKDISLKEFISVQTEINALEKKIEERERDLLKARKKFNEELHILAHVRELFGMKKNQLIALTEVNKRFIIQKERIRGRIFKLKLDREKLRKEINDLNYQSGLLSKQSLLHDYDATKDNYEAIVKRNDALKRKLRNSKSSLQSIIQKTTAMAENAQ